MKAIWTSLWIVCAATPVLAQPVSEAHGAEVESAVESSQATRVFTTPAAEQQVEEVHSATDVVQQAHDEHADAKLTGEAKEPRHQIELGTFFGVNWVNGEGQNDVESDTTMGVDAAVNVTLRTPYFLDPFIDVSYAFLSTSETSVVVPPSTDTTNVASKLYSWNFAAGPGVDLWRFRLRLGVGVATTVVANTVAGQTNTVNSLTPSSMLTLTGDLVTVPRFRTGIEARIVNMPGASIRYFAVGLSFRGDILQW